MKESKPPLASTSAPERYKKVNNTDLPKNANQRVWRRNFVSSYMQFAASQPDPWDIPSALACNKLQLLWDAIFPDIDYTVTTTSAVYLLVSGSHNYFILLTTFIHRFCNDLLTHGVALLVLPLFLLPLHFLNPKTTCGNRMKIGLYLQRWHWTNFDSATRRLMAMMRT